MNSVRNSMIIQNATEPMTAAAISMTGRMIIHAALEISLIVSIVMTMMKVTLLQVCGDAR